MGLGKRGCVVFSWCDWLERLWREYFELLDWSLLGYSLDETCREHNYFFFHLLWLSHVYWLINSHNKVFADCAQPDHSPVLEGLMNCGMGSFETGSRRPPWAQLVALGTNSVCKYGKSKRKLFSVCRDVCPAMWGTKSSVSLTACFGLHNWNNR